MRLIGGQAVELVDHLLDLAQVKQVARFAWEAHRQLALGDTAALRALDAFQATFHHLHLEVATGEVLLRQVGAAGDQAFGQVMVGDDFEQIIELRHAQALANVGLEQAVALACGQRVGAGKFDGFDREATGICWRCCVDGGSGFAGQVLELFEAALLLFEQAILAVTDQVGDAWRVLQSCALGHPGRAQAKKSGQQAKPGPTYQTPHF